MTGLSSAFTAETMRAQALAPSPAGTEPSTVTTAALRARRRTLTRSSSNSVSVTGRPGSRNSVEVPLGSRALMQERVSPATSTKSWGTPSRSRRSRSRAPA